MSARMHQGGCHCGKVRFEAEIDLDAGVSRCNCTICTKRSATGAIVKPQAFRLVAGEDALTVYSRHPAAAYHFCKVCGIHVFGRGDIPEIGGAYVSINVLTIDDLDPQTLKVGYFDGRHDNWMAGTRDTPWPVHAPG